MAKSTDSRTERMEKIVSLCKRRGFIFQSSEIYGGLNGAWDYGPLGAELKRNIKDHWWRSMTQLRDDVVGLDAAILMNRQVWQASGHESTFSDPLVDCRETKARYRADQIYFAKIEIAGQDHGYLSLIESPDMEAKARERIQEFKRKQAIQGDIGPVTLRLLTEATPEEFARIPSPASDKPGTLTPIRQFNLMFKTYVGPVEDDSNVTYLRPETAQAIFVQFRNVLDVSRMKLPFGIAQIGKAFRNEINPRNFTFRSREFEQMELEFFVRPEDGFAWLETWKELRLKWYEEIGIPRSKIHVKTVADAERAFYSKGTYDLEYEFPFGIQELEGIAYRTDYDLSAHIKHSGKPLDYFDEEKKERFVPHVVEPSAGVDRTALAVICQAYDEEEVTDDAGKTETRIVLRFAPKIAPIKVGIFPLLKNKPELVTKAREVAELLRPHMRIFYDETAAIGRRYRRQDEIGTPFGVTIDFETLEGTKDGGAKDTVTLRERDSMTQRRVPISSLLGELLPLVR